MKPGVFFTICLLIISVAAFSGPAAADGLPDVDEALAYAAESGDYSRTEVKNVLQEYDFLNDGDFESEGYQFIVFERLDAEGLFEESKVSCFDPDYREKRAGDVRLFLRNDLMLLLPSEMRAASLADADYYLVAETCYDLDQQIIRTIFDDSGNDDLPDSLEDPEALMLYLLEHPRTVKEYSYKPLFSVYAVISLYDARTKACSIIDYQYENAPLETNNQQAYEQWVKMTQLRDLIVSLRDPEGADAEALAESLNGMDFIPEDEKSLIEYGIETAQYPKALDAAESYFWRMAEDLSAADDSEEALKWYPMIISERDEETLELFVAFRNYSGIDTPDSVIIDSRLYIAEPDRDWFEQTLIDTIDMICS